MEVLQSSQPLSGPHCLFCLQHPSGTTIYLIGEEHDNQNQCWQQGADIVHVVLQCAREGVQVYIEMPEVLQNTEIGADTLVCMPAPANQPRPQVLNTLRTCALKLKQQQRSGNIHFIDPRELYGHLPYTDTEQQLVEAVAGHPADTRSQLQASFVQPVLSAAAAELPSWDASVQALWSTTDRANVGALQCAADRKQVQRVVDLYRTITDRIFNLHTLSKLLQTEGPQHVVYTGSAHTKALRQLLLDNMEFVQTDQGESPPSVSCVRRQKSTAPAAALSLLWPF